MSNNIQNSFEKIKIAALEYDEELVLKLFSEFTKDGLKFELINSEVIEWEESDDGYEYAEVSQKTELLLGNVIVSEWVEKYFAEDTYTGNLRLITCFDTDIDEGIEDLLEILEISNRSPVVPEPRKIKKSHKTVR